MLPQGYEKGVDRVSNIVSFVFPFKGEGKKRYLEWIYKAIGDRIEYKREFDTKKAIDISLEFPELSSKYDIGNIIECEEAYLKEAQDIGTFIHAQMEYYVLDKFKQSNKDPLYEIHYDVIEHGLDYLDEIMGKYDNHKWLPEQVVADEEGRYQGTIDLVRVDEENKTVYLYDWKSWGVAKKKWGLTNSYRKPYDKLKKLALQLSLYAETYRQKGYKIGGIYGVWLHETGAYEYSLDTYSSEEINKILTRFFNRGEALPSNIDLIINYNPMKIEVNTNINGQAYSNARVTLEEDDVKEFKSAEEAIDAAIKLQKYLLKKYNNE